MPAASPYLQVTVAEGQARILQPAAASVAQGWRIDLDGRSLLGDGRPYPVPPEAIRQSIGWTLYYRNLSGRSTTPTFEFPAFRFPRPPIVAPQPQPQPQYPPGRSPIPR
jgi:hypothetical protein